MILAASPAGTLGLGVFPTVDKVWISSKVSDPVLERIVWKANVDCCVPVVPTVLNQGSLRGALVGVGQVCGSFVCVDLHDALQHQITVLCHFSG